MKVRFKKILPGAKVPVYSSEFAAGADLCACVEESVTVKSGESVMLPTGSPSSFPRGRSDLCSPGSGLASKRSLAPANKVGVIDCDYRGEIKVALFNHGKCDQTVESGERIAQLVVVPYITAEFEEAQELSDTVRGEGGFGSTGR